MPKRSFGSVAATGGVILAFLGAGTRRELWERAKDWWQFVTASLGIDRIGVDGAILFAALLIGLWAWDVPQRLWHRWRTRNDPSLATLARSKRARAEATTYLRRLHDNTARYAIGDLYKLLDITALALKQAHKPEHPVWSFAGQSLQEPQRQLDRALTAMLNARDGDFDAYLKTYGELFDRYQAAVWWLNEAHHAAGIQPWSIKHDHFSYADWRKRDRDFVDAIKTLEHMEGCEAIIPMLKMAGWGDNARPAAPTG